MRIVDLEGACTPAHHTEYFNTVEWVTRGHACSDCSASRRRKLAAQCLRRRGLSREVYIAFPEHVRFLALWTGTKPA